MSTCSHSACSENLFGCNLSLCIPTQLSSTGHSVLFSGTSAIKSAQKFPVKTALDIKTRERTYPFKESHLLLSVCMNFSTSLTGFILKLTGFFSFHISNRKFFSLIFFPLFRNFLQLSLSLFLMSIPKFNFKEQL